MKLIQRGNSKLGSNMCMFNLPATKAVCKTICPGCYAAAEQVRYKQVLPSREARLEASKQPDFAIRVNAELANLRKPPKYFRIHASGEFYSQAYVDSWVTIALANPTIIFYAYTKRLKHFDFSQFKQLPNTVLINSLHFGKLNYSPKQDIPPNVFVCPASSTVQCGTDCNYCMTKQAELNGIWFIKH